MNYLAPDTVEEIIRGLALLEEWLGKFKSPEGDLLVPGHTLERSNRSVRIIKPAQGMATYREMLLYYGVKNLIDFFTQNVGKGQGEYQFSGFSSVPSRKGILNE
jgi:hypothetical protein